MNITWVKSTAFHNMNIPEEIIRLKTAFFFLNL